MIFGIGVDITAVKRFEKWVNSPDMIERFFNEKEIKSGKSLSAVCQHYAVRFAAKEAFSKALGTGISGFNLKDVYITNDEFGKPIINVQNSAEEILKNRCQNYKLHVSLSHEKEYAIAYVIIEES
ncbi:MAG: holo-ACP synthase [Treponema sp.]|nr:holo-ACP synthase [Treponema sp.]